MKTGVLISSKESLLSRMKNADARLHKREQPAKYVLDRNIKLQGIWGTFFGAGQCRVGRSSFFLTAKGPFLFSCFLP